MLRASPSKLMSTDKQMIARTESQTVHRNYFVLPLGVSPSGLVVMIPDRASNVKQQLAAAYASVASCRLVVLWRTRSRES